MSENPKTKRPSEPEELLPVLAENFKALRKDTGMQRLRTAMSEGQYGIGSHAIQSAERGSDSLTLKSLIKFARYFGVEPYQLLMPGLGAELRETVFSPEVLRAMAGLDADMRRRAENSVRAFLDMPLLTKADKAA